MKKILVIEDENSLRSLLSKALVEEGFEVLEAFDAEEGLKILRENKVDLILLDLILPGMSGFDLLAKIKSEPAWMPIPVLIISNLGQEDEIEKGLRLGASDYLIKANFTLDQILEKVKETLR